MAPTRRKSGNPLQTGHTRSKSSNGYSSVDGDEWEQGSNRGVEMDDIDSEDETLADDEETGLTEPERKKRTLRKVKSARLDQQISKRN